MTSLDFMQTVEGLLNAERPLVVQLLESALSTYFDSNINCLGLTNCVKEVLLNSDFSDLSWCLGMAVDKLALNQF